MKIMSIDIGTNSTLYLISDVRNGRIDVIDRGIVGNGLGAGVGDGGILEDDLISANRRILADLRLKADSEGCTRIGAVGTQALRSAQNSDVFIKEAGEVGIPVRIISDREEAVMSWQGVFNSRVIGGTNALLDIGGGSSELSYGNRMEPQWSDSVHTGAVRLCRRFFQNDPPGAVEIENACMFLNDAFKSWEMGLTKEVKLTGVAGTITALAALENNIVQYSSGCLEGLILKPGQVDRQVDKLLLLNLEQRKRIPGMPPARAGSIHAGALILKTVLGIIGKRDINVSEKGVIFGLALRLAQDN